MFLSSTSNTLFSSTIRRRAIIVSSKAMGSLVRTSSQSQSQSKLQSVRCMTTHGCSGIQKVTIVGAGTLGTQVALQTAITGHEVTVLDVTEDALEVCRRNHEAILQTYLARDQDHNNQARGWKGLSSVTTSTEQVVQDTMQRLHYTTDTAEAMQECDLVSENVPEVPDIKASTYAKLSQHCTHNEETIFTTNSSTLLPSDFVQHTGRPSKFVALHFANGIWDANIAEVMPHPDTDEAITQKVLDFAKDMHMVPFYVQKEQNGYLINSLLVPWLNAAQSLVTNGVSTPSDIDKVWLISMGGYHHQDPSTTRAPFIVMDMIGIPLVAGVFSYWGDIYGDAQMKANAAYLQEHYVTKDKLGITNGNPKEDTSEGIYSYPNPEFMSTDFLK